MKVLVIEDDARIGGSLQQLFNEAGEFCRWVSDGHEGLECVRSQEYDVVVLDILLPRLDGREILQTARQEGILTPVLLLTALGSVDHRVNGLTIGADDYLVKPFECAELLARVRALQRRSHTRPTAEVEAGGLTLSLSTREASWPGGKVSLSPTEASLLELLIRHAGELVTRKMIGKHLWDNDWNQTTNVVDVHIKRLRARLGPDFKPYFIKTVRGRGYVLRVA